MRTRRGRRNIARFAKRYEAGMTRRRRLPAMKKMFLVPLAFVAAGAPAQQAPQPTDQRIDYSADPSHRMTVSVSIGGIGPYRFVVDTGAERTVVSRQVAGELKLKAGQPTRVHSMSEASEVATVVIPTLEIGLKKVRGINAPSFEQSNLGADGILGVDTLKSQRVLFDFTGRQMTITSSMAPQPQWSPDAIVISARSRFGHLIVADASVDGERVWVIVDTGSQVTVGNSALKKKLIDRKRLGASQPIELVSVTGGAIAAQLTQTRRIRIGGVDINDLPIAFADVHPFKQLDLMDRPALLLGMDALQLFSRVSIDFSTRKLTLLRPLSIGDAVRMASARADGPGARGR
jgi:predicted aspartyl protease